MNGALIAAHAANAAAAKSREKVLDAFRMQGATAPERARPLAELGLPNDEKAFGTFVAAGVIRGVDSRGRPTVIGDAVNRTVAYYLDEPAFVAQRDQKTGGRQRRVILIVLLVFLAINILMLGVVLALRS
jgi:hypothetical protein